MGVNFVPSKSWVNRGLVGVRKTFAGVCLLIFSVARVWAATYYVDATGGNDVRSGTSPANAWRTLQRVNSTVLNPGDSVLLRRGGIWREKLYILQSGTAGSTITYAAYGTGAVPVIDGSDPVTGWSAAGAQRYSASVAVATDVVVFQGIKGIRETAVDHVDAPLEWYWGGGVLTVYSAGGAPTDVSASSRQFLAEFNLVDNITFRDIALQHGVDCVRLYDTANVTLENITIVDSAGYSGVLIGAQTPGRGQRNTVRGCTVSGITGSAESTGHGALGSGVFVWGMDTCRENTVSENVIHDNGGGGIVLISSADNTAHGNTVYNHGSAGIIVSETGASGNIIEYNHVYGNCLDENDCFGINLYMVGNNNLVRYNTVHGQYVFTDEEVGIPGFTERSGGIRFDGDTWIGVTDKTGNAITGNLVYDEYEGIQIFNFSNVAVYNNTISGTIRSGLYLGSYGATGTTRNCICRNNAIHSSAKQLV